MEIKKVLPVLIYFYTLLSSQSFTVKGIVKDKKTQKSLIGANVFIVGTSIGTSTDTDGKYRLPNVQLGSYKLKASYIGYQEVEVDITVTSTEDITQDFELSYVLIVLFLAFRCKWKWTKRKEQKRVARNE